MKEAIVILLIALSIVIAVIVPNVAPPINKIAEIHPKYVMDVKKNICFALWEGGISTVECSEEVLKEIMGK